MFSTIQLAISLVVTFILSALIGLAVGACGACLIMHKRSSLAMDQMNKPAEPAEYEEVQPNPWNIGVNTNTAYANAWNIGVNTAYGTAKQS